MINKREIINMKFFCHFHANEKTGVQGPDREKFEPDSVRLLCGVLCDKIRDGLSPLGLILAAR